MEGMWRNRNNVPIRAICVALLNSSKINQDGGYLRRPYSRSSMERSVGLQCLLLFEWLFESSNLEINMQKVLGRQRPCRTTKKINLKIAFGLSISMSKLLHLLIPFIVAGNVDAIYWGGGWLRPTKCVTCLLPCSCGGWRKKPMEGQRLRLPFGYAGETNRTWNMPKDS